MEKEISILEENSIRSKIHFIRGQQVMLDFDLAEIYGYTTKAFNQQVKNNIERFDDDFRFQLNQKEVQELSRSKILTLNNGRGSNIKYSPYAFTEQGIYMLMTVLKGELAVSQSKLLIRTFKEMKHFFQNNSHIFVELDNIRKHLLESDKKIDDLFSLMDKYNIKDEQGIYFQGQIFDAYAKFESFMAQAKKEIILIDNYVDLSVLQRLAKKNKGVNVIIYTSPKTKLTPQDVQAFNAQYPTLTLNHTTKAHDRFLIIDQATMYHIGASLKDLGKKHFAFSVIDAAYIPKILGDL